MDHEPQHEEYDYAFEIEQMTQTGRNGYMEAALQTLRECSQDPQAVAYAQVMATLAVALEERISRRVRAIGI